MVELIWSVRFFALIRVGSDCDNKGLVVCSSISLRYGKFIAYNDARCQQWVMDASYTDEDRRL